MKGLGKFQLHAKFEVAGFIYYGNINAINMMKMTMMMMR